MGNHNKPTDTLFMLLLAIFKWNSKQYPWINYIFIKYAYTLILSQNVCSLDFKDVLETVSSSGGGPCQLSHCLLPLWGATVEVKVQTLFDPQIIWNVASHQFCGAFGGGFVWWIKRFLPSPNHGAKLKTAPEQGLCAAHAQVTTVTQLYWKQHLVLCRL